MWSMCGRTLDQGRTRPTGTTALHERACIHHAHGELGLAVLDIVARHDPMDIVRDENPAEYEPVVQTILLRLHSARCVEDAQRIVREEVADWPVDTKAGRSRHTSRSGRRYGKRRSGPSNPQ
jgi:hypothetical protein